ncbi:hypothetical protein E3N88_36443 [Mikania micrantha]|uniref:Uncharacterized protein n=1 Tax=Mikania micrantha TaxID=192012 RepID=A0A5N6M6H2_9ASTR|nr:hypothetical protein E3N88_36443 [Mikania micrantha]
MPPKQLSGSQKRKKRKRDGEMRQSQSGAMFKFMNKATVEEHIEEHVEVVFEDIEEEQHVEGEEHVQVEPEEIEEQQHVEENVNRIPIDIFDPISWEGLNSDDTKLLVDKGPKRDTSIMYGPYNVPGPSGRRFSTALYTRILSNMEKCDREWLVYSRTVDKIFFFVVNCLEKELQKEDWMVKAIKIGIN